MSDDNVMYDSPVEFMAEAANSDGCMAQSVIPIAEGGYACRCSCGQWAITASSRDEGLRLARAHTDATGY
jgi:hypothetical protein